MKHLIKRWRLQARQEERFAKKMSHPFNINPAAQASRLWRCAQELEDEIKNQDKP